MDTNIFLLRAYKIGRFVFAITILLIIEVFELRHGLPSMFAVLAIYCCVSLVGFFYTSQRISTVDFILDLIFISALIYLSKGFFTYLSVLYLFPLFFASVIIRGKVLSAFPLTAILLYVLIFYFSESLLFRDSWINIFLHLFAFAIITLAGDNLKYRLLQQDSQIKRLNEERIKMLGYERLYRVSADLAHELRNPLASISSAVQFIKEGKPCADFIDMLDTETKRLINLVNDFLLLARPTDAVKETVDVTELLKGFESLTAQGKQIIMDLKCPFKMQANRLMIYTALRNIVANAIESAKGIIHICLEQTQNGNYRITIQDDGIGIAPELRDRVFEPFFTTKSTGTGLGLAIANRIISSYGGIIYIDSSELGGAKFSIEFKNQKTKE